MRQLLPPQVPGPWHLLSAILASRCPFQASKAGGAPTPAVLRQPPLVAPAVSGTSGGCITRRRERKRSPAGGGGGEIVTC